jgi:PAS domain S-box-containing protein
VTPPTIGSETLSLLNAVLSNAPFGFAVLDTDLRYVHINDLLAQVNGRTPQEHRGLKPADISPALDELVGPHLRRVRATLEPVIGLEVSAAPPGQRTELHWTFSCYPVTSDEGTLLGLAVAVVDITDAKRSHDRLERQAQQQAAIVELGLAALRGAPLPVLLEESLAMVRSVLGVDQAAILRTEREGSRFVLDAIDPPDPAALGTVAVTPGDDTQAGQTLAAMQPVVMIDRVSDTRFARIPAAVGLDVQSSVTVVIPTSQGPFGVLGTYCAGPWAVSDDDVRFVQGVATVLGTAVDRRRTEQELSSSTTRLRMAQEAARMGVWEWDMRTDRIVWSEALEQLYGLPAGGFDGTMAMFEEFVHPDDLPAVRAVLQSTVEEGTTYEAEHRILRADTGEAQWIVARGEVVRDERSRPTRMVGINIDITARKRDDEERAALLRAEQAARSSAERARERLTLLAEATAALSASLDYRETLGTLTRLIVPAYADICLVDLVETGRLRTVAVAHRDRDREAELWSLREQYPSATAGARGHGEQVLPDGASLTEAVIDDERLNVGAVDDRHHEMLSRLGARSSIIVPLTARGRVLGALSLLRAADRDSFDPTDDRALITELGRRAALAIDNARLFSEVTRTGERFRRMAETLQESLLPPNLPDVPGVDMAATYRAAAAGTTVGGDFYDVFPLPQGWGVVIGDVQGKGTEAAALTAIARHTLRTAGIRNDPAAALTTLNEVLLRSEEHAGRFCTVLYGALEPRDKGVLLQLASGGHPPALLRRAATGEVDAIGGAGTLMGALPDADLNVVPVVLSAGDALVFYTDGVTEARGPGGEFGEDGLAAVLAAPAATAAAYVQAITDAVTAHSDGAFRDDIAILALRITE